MPDPIEISEELRAALAGGGEKEEEVEITTLLSLIGREIVGPNNERFRITLAPGVEPRMIESLLKFKPLGEIVQLRSDTRVIPFTPGNYVDVLEGSLFSTNEQGVVAGGRTLSQSEREAVGIGFSTPSTGGSAPSFASSQAAQSQAEAFQREQDRLDREFQAEQGRLAEEGANRRDRLGALTRLIEGFLGQQSQARDTLANLQPDPFRFAAVAGGIAPFGATPQQGFQQQLQQFAGASVPQFDPSGSASSLDPIIAQLTGAQAPQQPQGFGMAGGGTVPAPFDAMSARLVGEKGPEVMVTGPQGVTILPLGKGAQDGGFFPFQPIEFDRESLFPALGTSGIFNQFSQIPQTTRLPSGSLSFSNLGGFSGQGADFLQKLGVRPSLIGQAGGEGGIFFRAPGTDELQRISSPQAFSDFGFQSSDVTALSPQTIQQMGLTFGNTLQEIPPVPTGQPSPFTKFSAPIIEPTTGVPLPAPFTVASQLNKLRLTAPFKFNLLLSAYRAAGVPVEAVLGSIQASLPFGQERGTIGLN